VSRVVIALLLGLASARADAQRQPGWEVRLPERIELVAGGEPGTLSVAIAVDRGLVVSKDAPVMLDLAVPAGVTVKKARLGRGDAVDPGADAPRFAVALRPIEPGEHVLKLRLRFWICGARACRPVDVRRQTTVVVAPPAG